jgi:hypothetical protein
VTVYRPVLTTYAYKVLRNGKVKGEIHHRTGREYPEVGTEAQLYKFFNLGVKWGEWLMPRSGRFNSGNNTVTNV